MSTETHHLYSRFDTHASPPTLDFVTTTGEVKASCSSSSLSPPLPLHLVSCLSSLQNKGLMYFDAFPVAHPPFNKISIKLFISPSAFVTCTPNSSNVKNLNNYIKQVINHVYNIKDEYEVDNSNNKQSDNNISNNNNNNNNNDITNENNSMDTGLTNTSTSTSTYSAESSTASASSSSSSSSSSSFSASSSSSSASDSNFIDTSPSTKAPSQETTTPAEPNSFQFDPLQLYSFVKPSNTEPQLDHKTLSHALVPTLRPYQLRAANWMVQREKEDKKKQRPVNPSTLLHPLWTELEAKDGKKFYFNGITGVLTFQKFTIDEGEFSDSIPGGILADEPGLGKTLEMLALVLTNPSNITVEPPIEKEVENKENGRKRKGKGKGKAQTKENGKEKGKGKEREIETRAQSGRKRKKSIEDEEDGEYNPSSSKAKPKPKQKKATEGEEEENRNEIVDCPCGKTEEEHTSGLWLCCDNCNAWVFGPCVGHNAKTIDQGAYFECPRCDLPPPPEEIIDAKGTLIVCPLAISIREQWRQEIERHTIPGTLSVRVYHGIRFGDKISPRELAQFDIVLTTYDVLRTELDHLDTSGRESTLRNKKKYQIEPTPLASLHWWRVCLDEAQMVESTSTKAAMMALHLRTHYRWCVTGTPIQRGLEDLYGLLLFLQASPFDDKFWWHNAIQIPYEHGVHSAMERLSKFLRPIMWRNSKDDVKNELQLPEQKEKEVKLLRFSAVESTFYRKQHEDCSSKARTVLRTLSNRKSPITTRLRSAKILRPLLRLRQACCHPQVGSRGIRALQKNSLTMDELLDHLIMTAKVDCQEAQRAVLANMNGLAALDIIDENINSAAEKYRTALGIIETNEKEIEADKLQQLHIYHNLAEMVSIGNLTSNTLRDSTFKTKAEDLRNQLVAYRENQVGDASFQLREIKSKIVMDPSFYRDRNTARSQPWWLEAARFLDEYKLFNEFMVRIEQREANNTAIKEFWKELSKGLRDPAGLAFTLTTAYDELFKLRNEILAKIEEIDVPLTPAYVTHATSCGKCARDVKKIRGTLCKNCECTNLIEKYQRNLHTVNKKKLLGKDEEEGDEEMEEPPVEDEDEDVAHFLGTTNAGNAYGDSEYEHMLQEMVGLIRTHDRGNPMLQSAQRHFEALATMKEECIKIKAFITAKQDLINVLDEVDMAVMRMRLRYPGEPVLAGEELFKLHPAEVDPTRSRLKAELVVHETDLQKLKGQVHYLKSLSEARKRQAARRQQQQLARELRENSNTSDNPAQQKLVHITDDIPLTTTTTATTTTAATTITTTTTTTTMETTTTTTTTSTDSSSTNPPSNDNNINNNSIPPSSSTSSASSSSAVSIPSASSTPLSPSSDVIEEDEGTCPVCRESFTSDVVILTCGHTFCYECMMFMIERIRLGNTFKCPQCRMRMNIDEISYVSESSGNQGEYAHINVKGSWGTKIEAVVRELMYLRQMEEGVKVLLFSQWNEVLEIVSRALSENSVKFTRVHGKRSVEKAINTFKKDPGTTALLLPVASGANGLNLVEATHVFLVDPLLNPAAEAQAINRVHRIGQTKVTLIHRFIVGGTIEEKVWSLGKHKAEHQHSDFWRMQSKKEHDLLTIQDFCELFADANGNI